MNKSLIPITVVAVSAAAFVGCEWGGVHSGESWNDAYSWANFTGTYKLATPVVEDSTDGSTASFSRSHVFDGNRSYNAGKTALVPGSVSVTIAGLGSFTDNGDGSTTFSGSGSHSVTINHSAGTVSITLAGTIDPYIGKSITISGKYSVSASSGSSSPITWLNVNQKGNLLTIQDSNGVTYSGKITGASCPTADESGYITAAHIRFPFEATSANGKIRLSGSLSGDWSGSSSATTGTLSNRTIDANYSRGSSNAQFMAVSGSVAIYTAAVGSGS